METRGTEDEAGYEHSIPIVVRGLQLLAAASLVLGLFVYSLYGALFDGNAAAGPARRESASRAAPTTAPSAYNALASAGFRPTTQFLIFILCDGETVAEAIYSGLIYNDSVTLQATHDRNLILAVIQGQPTMLPASARVMQSECFRLALESGAFV